MPQQQSTSTTDQPHGDWRQTDQGVKVWDIFASQPDRTAIWHGGVNSQGYAGGKKTLTPILDP